MINHIILFVVKSHQPINLNLVIFFKTILFLLVIILFIITTLIFIIINIITLELINIFISKY